MTGAARAEIYFIAAMMVLILIVSGASVYFFFKQYKKEMKERAERKAKVVEKTQAVKSDQPG
jgi:uncharacterized protein YpmB